MKTKLELRKTLLLSVVILFFSSCASTSNYEKNLNVWIGHSESELVSQWGIPQSYETPDGIRFLSYMNSSTSAITNKDYFGNYTTIPISHYCKTTFILKQGVVDQWQHEGDSCRN